MKRLISIISFYFILLSSAQATHVLGGEITWECQSNGSYVFYMTFYRDCSGINWSYQNESIQIIGNPLPRNLNNTVISTIVVQPDSNRWLQLRSGDISPLCDTSSGSQSLNCANGDDGSVQQFFYQSNPIRFNNKPDSLGWTFAWAAPCCRPTVDNLTLTGSMVLFAKMYADTSSSNVACMDNSPVFKSSPDLLFCRGVGLTNEYMAFDQDGDSLVYRFSNIFNTPIANPTQVPYRARFNFDNPTPDSTFNPNNQGSTLNSSTGIIRFKNFSDFGRPPTKYVVSVQVDAYRNGVKNASVRREMPINTFDCPTLNPANPSAAKNQSPNLNLDTAEGVKTLHVTAGDFVDYSISAVDLDTLKPTNHIQTVRLTPQGLMFAKDFADTTDCAFPPCATLANQTPIFDSTKEEYAIEASQSVSTQLKWQTTCAHIKNNKPTEYYFYFRAQDDFCPVPAVKHAALRIVVHPSEINKAKLGCMDAAAVGTNIFWDANLIDSAKFISWHIYRQYNGTYLRIDTIASFNQTSYNDVNFTVDSGQVYQIIAKSNSCKGVSMGVPSDTIRYVQALALEINNVIATTSPGSYQWIDCASNSNIVGETNSIFEPKDTGSYAVIVRNGFCVDTSNCIQVFPVGLAEAGLDQKISIYPNPTQGQFTIQLTKEEVLDLRILNLQGQLMQQQRIVNQRQINLNLNAPKGIYLIEIQNESGERVVKKIVKQ